MGSSAAPRVVNPEVKLCHEPTTLLDSTSNSAITIRPGAW